MNAGEIIAAVGVGLAFLANLALAMYNYGRLSQKVQSLGNHLSTLSKKVDGLGERLARLEGRLNKSGN